MFENLVTELKFRGYEAEEVTLNKNGVPHYGIRINNGSNVLPVVYPTDNDTVDSLIEVIEKNRTPDFGEIDICNWEYVKDKLVACVCGRGKEEVPVIHCLDLDTYARVVLDIYPEGCGMASTKVTASLLNAWGKTIGEVMKVATENSFKDLTICHMLEALKDLIPDDFPEELLPIESDYPMYVISNAGKVNGAINMFNPEVFERLREKLGDDFVILPSSLHECIAVPYSEEADYSSLVAEVNSTQLAEEDKLSDTVYRFKDGVLAIA